MAAASRIRDRLAGIKEDLDNQTSLLHEREEEKKSLDARIIVLEAEVLSCSSKLSMLDKQLDVVEQEQEEIKHDVSARKERLVEKEQQMEALESDQDKDEDLSVSLEETSKRLTEEITEAEGILEDHKRRLRVLSSMVEKREEESEKHQDRISRSKEQLNKVNVEISEMEQDEMKLSEDECALRDELKGINAEFLDADSLFENLVRHRTSLEHIISEKNKKLRSIVTECDRQKKTIEDFVAGIDEL
eukprot:TRINITY_DN19092_c0_g1_i1.p1 TRINITY_DN19092_c0_g1~~TRINITY_DN19092_c0_g1_i1.p1  ORF type:complete len:246 (+),score=36.03 TRINITY_DN19092_c0_g1_i1:111-848(+)